jgi:hypothetical protein
MVMQLGGNNMTRFLFAVLLFVNVTAVGAHAAVVSPAGRADIKYVFQNAKTRWPNRYAGTLKDMKSLRMSCAYLQDVKSHGVKGPKGIKPEIKPVAVMNNRQAVDFLHSLKADSNLIATLQDRQKRIDQALPPDIVVGVSVYLVVGLNYLSGDSETLREPRNLRANVVGLYDDFVTAVKDKQYSSCVQMVDDVLPQGESI